MRADMDRLARWIVMLRAGAALVTDEGREQWWGKCQRCPKVDWLSWCHVITRGADSVRWNSDNAFAWCSGCHRWLDQHWEQKLDWVIGHIGEERWQRVRMLSNGGRGDYAAQRVAMVIEVERLTGVRWQSG